MSESNRRIDRFRPSLSGKRGFTLLELVLVIVVAVVAITPLLGLYSNATVKSVQPVLVTQAVFLAQEKIETIVADSRTTGRGYDYIINSNYPNESNPTGFSGFTISVSVSVESLYQSVQFKLVDVTVSHDAIDDVVLSTWVTN